MTIKGLPWPRGTVAYHATTALSAVMDEGLKTRAEIGRHATGMGPESAISFTLDPRVAYAICIGLRALARGTKGKLLLGDAIIQARKLGPKGLKTALEQAPRRTAEEVERRDDGWIPFRWRESFVEFGLAVASEQQLDDLVENAGAEDIIAHYATREGVIEQPFEDPPPPKPSKPFRVVGWVRWEDAMAAVERWHADPAYYLPDLTPDNQEHRVKQQLERVQELKYRPWFAEWYKRWLHFAHFAGLQWNEGEVYDPLFMGTDLEPLYHQNVHDIGIVAAEIDAEHLCIPWREAQSFGFTNEQLGEYLRFPVTASDWHGNCERYLQNVAEGRTDRDWFGPRGTAAPDPSDTVLYKSEAMSELRVYDSSVVQNLRVFASMRQVLDETIEEWADPDTTNPMSGPVELERPPIAFPFFRGEPVVDWTEPNPKIVSLDPLIAAAANPEEE